MQPLLADAGETHFFSMEHIHVLINHLPVIGLAMGFLALALAVLAAAALFAPHKWPRTTRPLAVACEGASGWIALAGGQIRHPEFCNSPGPSTEPTK